MFGASSLLHSIELKILEAIKIYKEDLDLAAKLSDQAYSQLITLH
jgi:hypothetical protein